MTSCHLYQLTTSASMMCTSIPSQGLRKQALRTHTTTGLGVKTGGPERGSIAKAFAGLVSFNLQLGTTNNHLEKKKKSLNEGLSTSGWPVSLALGVGVGCFDC